ncbi:hypothetical protein HDV05_006299 [Chytridiales sp. JEL 0842]|nr:hypothetical protein HDV05_006299 [Chytridiales sp. JEL 0842]
MKDLELFSWGPAWDLTTFDPACLSIQAYLTFVGARWVVNNCSNASVSPTGELPMLRDGLTPIAGTGNIIRYLKRKGYELDGHLTPAEAAQCTAYISLIEDKLYDALLYNHWLESENYHKSTLPTLSKSLSWIKRYYIPTQLQERAKQRLKSYRFSKGPDGKPLNEVYKVARDCYKALATKLGDQPYFFGEFPTSLDCIAYAHLAVHAVPALNNPQLFSMLAFEFPTLIAYVARIQKHLFEKTPPRLSPYVQPTSVLRDVLGRPWYYAQMGLGNVRRWWRRMNGEEPPEERRDEEEEVGKKEEEKRLERLEVFYKGLSVVGALSFFVGYVVYNGIIRIEVVDTEDAAEESREENHVMEEAEEKERRGVLVVDEDGNVLYDEEVEVEEE